MKSNIKNGLILIFVAFIATIKISSTKAVPQTQQKPVLEQTTVSSSDFFESVASLQDEHSGFSFHHKDNEVAGSGLKKINTGYFSEILQFDFVYQSLSRKCKQRHQYKLSFPTLFILFRKLTI